MKKTLLVSGLTALVVSLVTIGLVHQFDSSGQTLEIEHINSTPAKSAVYTLNEDGGTPIPLDFTQTAEKAMEGIVYIKRDSKI